MNRTLRAGRLVAVVALGVTALAGCGGGGDAAEQIPEPEERQNVDALHDRYAALEGEVQTGVQDVGYRVERVLVAPDGDRPEEQFSNSLGPEDPEATEGEGVFFDNACALGGVSCEVSELEGLLENDREDFADEDEYGPDACDITADRSYYEGYDLDAVAPGAVSPGADYVALREKLRDASDGLGDEATRLAQTAREMEAAEEDYEEASGFEAVPNWSAAEVEALAGQARAAESETGEALAAADERYAGYEERVEEVRAEALALHDQEGC